MVIGGWLKGAQATRNHLDEAGRGERAEDWRDSFIDDLIIGGSCQGKLVNTMLIVTKEK